MSRAGYSNAHGAVPTRYKDSDDAEARRRIDEFDVRCAIRRRKADGDDNLAGLQGRSESTDNEIVRVDVPPIAVNRRSQGKNR